MSNETKQDRQVMRIEIHRYSDEEGSYYTVYQLGEDIGGAPEGWDAVTDVDCSKHHGPVQVGEGGDLGTALMNAELFELFYAKARFVG